MTVSNNDTRINLVRIAHVFYTHKDIEKAHQFLLDFGFQEVKRVGKDIYYRGTSAEPFLYCATQGEEDVFGGAAFVVESESDLVAAEKLPGATQIYKLSDAPGGGRCVTFYDPVDNFPFHLVYGQTSHADEKMLPQLDFNFVSCLCITLVLLSHLSDYHLFSQRRNIGQATRPSDFRKVSEQKCKATYLLAIDFGWRTHLQKALRQCTSSAISACASPISQSRFTFIRPASTSNRVK